MKEYYKDQFRCYYPMLLLIDPVQDHKDGYEDTSKMLLSHLYQRLADTVYEVDVIINKMMFSSKDLGGINEQM